MDGDLFPEKEIIMEHAKVVVNVLGESSAWKPPTQTDKTCMKVTATEVLGKSQVERIVENVLTGRQSSVVCIGVNATRPTQYRRYYFYFLLLLF